jgi:GTP diphosphokinase / guanosine-3',5'-bis(diphosphate) 3'-diphosphatase
MNDLLAGWARPNDRARVVETLYPELAQARPTRSRPPAPRRRPDRRPELRRAPCCQPVPGERIVGITYRGQGVVVHAIDCPALEEFEEQPERWVDLHWHSGRHRAVTPSRWT